MAGPEKFVGAGFVTSIPGVYSHIETAAESAQIDALGVVALVSATSFFRAKPYTPVHITTSRAFREAFPTFGARFGKTCFKPSTSEDIPGGASRLICVNAAPSTRSTYALTSTGPVTQVTISSRLYGLEANQIWFKLEAGTTQGKKFTVGFQGTTTIKDDIGGDNIMSLRYSETEATTMLATVNPASGVTISYTKLNTLNSTPTDSYTPDNMAFDGIIALTITDNSDVDSTNGAGITFTVTGTDTDGVARVDPIAFLAGDTTKNTNYAFRTVTSITKSAGAWGVNKRLKISGNAFALTIAGGYTTILSVVDRINQAAAAGFAAVDIYGDGLERTVATMDLTSNQDIETAIKYFKADLDFLVKTIGNDEADEAVEPLLTPLLIAARGASATGTPDNYTTATYLTGGANGTPTESVGGTWDLALEALEDESISELWPESTSDSVHALLATHGDYMHGQGGDERMIHIGTAAQPTKATVKAKAAALNREYFQLWVNETQMFDENNKKRWVAPMYLALRAACAYAGAKHPVMPLTWKVMDVLDIREGSDWTFKSEGEDLVAASACILSKAQGQPGFWVVRDVTTYRKKDDPLKTQGSTVRSMIFSEKDIRTFLLRMIGQPNFEGSAAHVLSQAKSRLDYQRDVLKYLKGWSSATLEDLGTVFKLNTDRNPVEPILAMFSNASFSRATEILKAAA